jgi:hypothetical protein
MFSPGNLPGDSFLGSAAREEHLVREVKKSAVAAAAIGAERS